MQPAANAFDFVDSRSHLRFDVLVHTEQGATSSRKLTGVGLGSPHCLSCFELFDRMRDPSHRPAKRKERLFGLKSEPRVSIGIREYEIRLEIAELFHGRNCPFQFAES